MTLVVGIDPSAKKIAIVSTHTTLGTISTHAFPLYEKGTTRQTPAALANALRDMRKFLQWAELIAPQGTRRLAWVENPLVGRGGVGPTVKQAFIGGIIRAVLADGGFEVHDVNVSTWKKEVCGSGAAQKPLVVQTVKQKWPKADALIRGDGDLTDAAAIALYGIEVIERARIAGTPTGLVGGVVLEP